jgi:hypothetical protein
MKYKAEYVQVISKGKLVTRVVLTHKFDTKTNKWVSIF